MVYHTFYGILSCFLLHFTINIVSCVNRPKPFHFAIVDEVDSVLIDEGRNPLLISGEVKVLCLPFYLLLNITFIPFHFLLFISNIETILIYLFMFLLIA